MRAASTDTLVQRTLHPPKIPWLSSAGSSSASSADRGGASPVVPRSQNQASTAPSSSSTQQGRKRRGRKGRAPFSAAPAALVGNARVPGRSPPDGGPLLLQVRGCLSAHWRHWQALGAKSRVPSILRGGYRILFRDSPPLPSLAPRYRLLHLGQDLLGHWPRTRRSRSCCPWLPWESSSIRVPASPVVFS